MQMQSSLLRPHILLLAAMHSKFFHSLVDTWSFASVTSSVKMLTAGLNGH
jgi:hypothetical protein